MFVQIDSLTNKFGPATAVDRCSLQVAGGQFIGIVGMSQVCGREIDVSALTPVAP